MNEQDANFDVKNIVPVDLRLLNGQVNLILKSLELYAHTLEFMLDNEKSSDEEKQKKIAMVKYNFQEVLAHQAEQVNGKQNEFNKDNKFAQNMMQDNNIIDIIPSESKLKVI